MSKLEPTLTDSNLTATEILRRLLDERGVEWDYGIAGATTTRFNVNGVDLTFTPMRDGLVCSTILTPEQAIAATLGATDANPTQAESSWTCHEQELLDRYKAENRKLREFARDMWCMTTFCHGTSDAEIADMYRRMRELGFMENYGDEEDE